MIQAIVRLVIAPLARLIYRPVIEGRENVPRQGRVILASNHLSFIDSIVIPLWAPRPVVFLAKAEYFRGKGLRGRLVAAFFSAIDAIGVERGTHGAAQASLDAALEVLRADKAFGIYPEGSRSRDGRIYRGKTGVAWLAFASGAPVVPVGVIGTDRIQPIGKSWPRIHRPTIRYGEPLVFDPPGDGIRPAQARRKATDEIMAAIGELTGQEPAGIYNDPVKAEPAG
ncbi:1-acyl-sn-glycerol-3-phosphate acyltransferase [Kribbella sp. NBC_01245]|uniref:lysophospholipid acyltransferase family protein n=1 Tax=Kribbella sp. NBC_01245 TaxID=2903578 RepID=UPI002E2AB04F|nr:lysophospholipid acyltransferase family protein [Kribbella sp. NBC_01245]